MKNKLKQLFQVIFLVLLATSTIRAEVNNQTLAVLVNINDPESIEIAEYYQQSRKIPNANIIRLSFPAGLDVLTKLQFEQIEAQLNKKVSDNIQAYAVAWRKPWRVDCMSVTSAFALGFNQNYCAKGCKTTRPVKYFNSKSHNPYTDYAIRPSMMLSAGNLDGVKRLIDRGVASDLSMPNGTAYLLSTSDKQRNVRAVNFSKIRYSMGSALNVRVIKADAIKNTNDILFYFTGQKKVKWTDKNQYQPGAIADHLTSTGGRLFNGSQMSILKWIDSGVTGSYGTVVEPCNFLQKFPSPHIVMQKYLSGNSLIEAYWKSVAMPGQGVFVGEPLATPFKQCRGFTNRFGLFGLENKRVDNLVERQSKNCNMNNFINSAHKVRIQK